MKKIVIIMAVFVILCVKLDAQDRNEVLNAYNEGAKASKTDIKAAITSFENVITLAEKVGEPAADLKQKAVQVLPGLYFKVAYNALNEKKPAREIIQSAKAAIAAADKYGSASNKTNSQKVLLQGYNNLGGEYFSKSEYENALAAYDTVLSLSPDNTNAIYNKSLIYIKQNNPVAVEQNTDLLIEKLKGGKDTARVKQVSTIALEYFRSAGSQASQAEKLDEALALLNKASKYGEDKDLYYYYADVYNKQKSFDKGAESAQKGLALETGTPEAKAKFYFQLGLAQEGKGQTAEACASFKNSLFGAFAEPSKAKRTNLKCK
ncbi:MAG: tetratricopeptide repeat protein [Bacteroidia bacterium]|nr:tetratricopeptide repeat protein [Bacteroidia bacterium]